MAIGLATKRKLKDFFFDRSNMYIGQKQRLALGYRTDQEFYEYLKKLKYDIEDLAETPKNKAIQEFKTRFDQAKAERKRSTAKTRKNNKETLNNELEEFKKNLSKLPNPSRPKFKPKKQRKNQRLTTHRRGDMRIEYNFQTTLKTNVGDDSQVIIKNLIDEINLAFELPSIQKLLRTAGSWVGIVAHPSANNIDSGTIHNVSSTYNPTKEESISNLNTKLREYLERYNSDIIEIEEFDIVFFLTSANQGAGTATRSINVANTTWKICDVKTRNNCLYASIVLAMNYQRFRDFEIDKETNDRVINTAKQLKKHMKEKGFEVKALFSNEEEIKMCSEYLKTPIKVYNNLFRVIQDYTPINKVCRKTKAKDTIEIQISNNHYKALLRRSVIKEAYIEEQPENVFVQDETEDKLITKRIFDSPQIYNYGAYDIEATPDTNNNNYHKAYACGITYYFKDEFIHQQFWGMDCQIQFIDYLIKNINKLNGYTLYAHNGGKYDYPNLLREAVLNHKGIYIKNLVELNGRLMSFYLTDGNHKIHFRDSSCIFVAQSLDSITKALNVKHLKLKELVKHDEINLDNYLTHRPEITKYLEHDCTGLLECILSFANSVYEATQINLSQVFTGATLAKKHFYKNHYRNASGNIMSDIYFLSKEKDKFIRGGYFGGRTEAFRLNTIKGKVFYDDFTSLYPSMAHSNRLPYGKPEWVEFKSNDDFKGFFGFCDVYVRSINFEKKPIHATNHKIEGENKRLFAHYQDWKKMNLFSQEIRLGMEKGMYEYKFEGCKGIRFKSGMFMRKVFQECFDQKQKNNDNEAMRMTWKIIANSLYGFWGLRWTDRESLVIEKSSEVNLNHYLESRKLINVSQMGEYTTLNVQKDLEMEDFNVSIAAAITSYSRMKLWNLINDIEERGFEVYYCDTDSVISNCNIRKDEFLQKTYCPDMTGDALGSLKNECLDKIKKHNKKTDNKVDLKVQTETDGGEVCFDEVIICGCKWYALKKTCYNGEELIDTKLKGYREGNKEDKNYKPLLYEDYERLSEDKSYCISQVQMQFNIPKSSYLDEDRRFGLKIIDIPKKFRVNYKKGIVDENGKIHPYVL